MDFQTLVCYRKIKLWKLNPTLRRNPGTNVTLRPNRHKFKWHSISSSDTDVPISLDLSRLYADFAWFLWIFSGFWKIAPDYQKFELTSWLPKQYLVIFLDYMSWILSEKSPFHQNCRVHILSNPEYEFWATMVNPDTGYIGIKTKG